MPERRLPPRRAPALRLALLDGGGRVDLDVAAQARRAREWREDVAPWRASRSVVPQQDLSGHAPAAASSPDERLPWEPWTDRLSDRNLRISLVFFLIALWIAWWWRW